MKQKFLPLAFLVLLMSETGIAQPFSLKVYIQNQPASPVVLGSVKGDKFTPVDTVMPQRFQQAETADKAIRENAGSPVMSLQFDFPSGRTAGVYRLMLGQTTYARVMGEPAQQLDFIFNRENIVLKTDFKSPEDSLQIIQSAENQVWHEFLKQQKEYRKQLNMLEQEMDYLMAKMEEIKASGSFDEAALKETEAKAAQKANDFNQLQLEHDRFILQLAGKNEKLYASRLIPVFREPFRDGFLSGQERFDSYQRDYFRHVRFADESLINSPVLSDKIFSYLVTFNRREYNRKQREAAYISAVDKVMKQVEQAESDQPFSGTMYEFVLNYLVNGFEKLNMENVLVYLADNYLSKYCQPADEKTTLARKLAARQMKVGMQVPDFTLNDMDGQPVTFSRIAKPGNLIIFWASWCSHCLEMLPRIKSWYAQRNHTDLQVIAISLDHSKPDWQKAASQIGTGEFVNLSDLLEWNGPVTENYNVYATPTMFLVDRNRKILAKPLTVSELIDAAGR